MIRWCFMKFSSLTSRSAQNPGFKKEAAARVIINKMKPHPLQRFKVKGFISMLIHSLLFRLRETHKGRNTWLPSKEGAGGTGRKNRFDFSTYVTSFNPRNVCVWHQRREEEEAETGRWWYRGEDWEFIWWITGGSGVQRRSRPLPAAAEERTKGLSLFRTLMSDLLLIFSLFKWRRIIIMIIINTLLCVVSTEQVKEDQREVQRPGWRGPGADDAAARGEDRCHTHSTQTCCL